jgi:hypothetical protein
MYVGDDSAEDFSAFLSDHRHHRLLFDSLARVDVVQGPKDDILEAEIARRENGEELLQLRRMRALAKVAVRHDLSEQDWQRLLKTGDPHVLRGLAANPKTPEGILRELTGMTNQKFAKQIRALALETLRRRRQ